ncbi:hypothetical protein DVH24_010973 [Malus domestica]|uniref:Leucine-rich repeat-containing N-terminal plant-type domain-containing protein n=1 Tax=Malus domestica TaxID=3750 RepID=A0A498JS91_MALDO|nr:hypothetical protein DVH24_010973 [Malus domestica]
MSLSSISKAIVFSGPIPSNFGQLMPKLEILHLAENHLNGTIPSSHCSMQNLSILSLTSNWCNILSSMGVSSSRVILKMNNNNFGNATSLCNIDRGNKFTGSVPLWIRLHYSELCTLRLQSDFLSGHIHCHNKLSGTIPKCLKNLTALRLFPYHNYTVPTYYDVQTTTLDIQIRYG